MKKSLFKVPSKGHSNLGNCALAKQDTNRNKISNFLRIFDVLTIKLV
jgi:hypothetical protein